MLQYKDCDDSACLLFRSEYVFCFDNAFELHNDIDVLKKMGLDCGLHSGSCSSENLKQAKSMLPKAFGDVLEGNTILFVGIAMVKGLCFQILLHLKLLLQFQMPSLRPQLLTLPPSTPLQVRLYLQVSPPSLHQQHLLTQQPLLPSLHVPALPFNLPLRVIVQPVLVLAQSCALLLMQGPHPTPSPASPRHRLL